MARPDDSSLEPDERRAVEERARQLLNRAAAWGRFPTPLDDIVAAANLTVARKSVFDLEGVVAYLKGKAADAAHQLKSAISKIFGVYPTAALTKSIFILPDGAAS